MNGGDAPFAYSGLERIFHERGRLAVCTCLVANPHGMRFTELQDACALDRRQPQPPSARAGRSRRRRDGTHDRPRTAGDDGAHHRRRTAPLSRLRRRTGIGRARRARTLGRSGAGARRLGGAIVIERDRTLRPRRDGAAPRRDHHGRQPPLGREQRAAGDRRPPARHARRCAASITAAAKAGIDVLTVYAFSEENWGRERSEVGALMDLGAAFARREADALAREDVRVRVIGRRDRLPPALREAFAATRSAHGRRPPA